MNPIESHRLYCPWCGRPQEIAIDSTVGAQEYVEDCWICCQPMLIRIQIDPREPDRLEVSVECENG